MIYNLDEWIFNRNSYTNLWSAVKREDYFELFNGDKGHVLSSSSIETLVELILKTGGDTILLKKLTSEESSTDSKSPV